GLQLIGGRIDCDLLLFSKLTDRVEFLEPESDPVDQCVAACATGIREMNFQPLPRCEGLLVSDPRQRRVYAGRRRRDDLAEKMFAHEKPALCRRGVSGLAGD